MNFKIILSILLFCFSYSIAIFGSKASPAYTTGYEYNTNGTIKKIIYPEETASLRFKYDYGSILKKITKTNGGGDQVLIDKEIDPNHLVCTAYKLYGLDDKPIVNTHKSTRDDIIEAISFNGNFLSTFFYDKRGLKVRTGQWVDSGSDYNRSYTYDGVKRLIKAEPDTFGYAPVDKFLLETFDFDKFDYISSAKIDGTTQTYTKRGFRNQYYSFVSDNKTKKFKYDNRGNLIEDVDFIYEWDDFDRIKSARKKVKDFIKTPLPEAISFTEETANNSKVFTQNWAYGTGIHSVKLEGVSTTLTRSQISLELLNEQSNFVPVEFIVESSTGNDLELLINFTNLDFSSRGARVTIADTTVTLTNVDGLIGHPLFEVRGGAVEVQDSQSVTANFISLNQLDEIVVDIPLSKFNSNSTVEIDTGSGFVSVPFAFGVKSTDLAGQTTLVVFEQSGVSKIRITLDNPMDAVTAFEVRTFGNAELPERVDYMYDASNRRVARLFTGVANLSIERAVYDGMKVIEERQYTTGQLQRRYYHGDGDNRIIAVEEDADNDGIVDEATDNVYIPLLDDRGTLMGVANKTGFIIEKLYYNSTGLVKSFIWDGNNFVEAVDTNGNNIGRSLFIRSGWTGLYHEPFTQKYHALFRDYDPQHQRWLSEDPAGEVDGMNLYHAYMNVNYIDLMGDNKFENFMNYFFAPERSFYMLKGALLCLSDTAVDLYEMAGAIFKIVSLNTFEENAEIYNKALKTSKFVLANKEQILKEIVREVLDYSKRYSQAILEGKDKTKAWEMEGRIACEVALMFIGVGEIKALAKSSKFLKTLQLVTKSKLDKAFKGIKETKTLKIVEEFFKSNCKYNPLVCFPAGTQVLTDQGLKNIEDIKVGDFVLSKNQKTQKTDYKPVVNVFTVLHAELFTLTYKDKTGEAYEIKVSGEHPFWVADKGWVSARQLAINDRLEITDNTYVAVTGLTSEPAKLGETFTTYNFEVDDFHTYFVLQEGKTNGAFAVLVHNAKGCGILVDNDVLVHALDHSDSLLGSKALNLIKNNKVFISTNQYNEFAKFKGISRAQRHSRLQFLMQNNIRILTPENSNAFKDLFKAIAKAQGRGDAAFAALAMQTGLKSYTANSKLARWLTNSLPKRFRNSNIPVIDIRR